jgi:hypothetical protein
MSKFLKIRVSDDELKILKELVFHQQYLTMTDALIDGLAQICGRLRWPRRPKSPSRPPKTQRTRPVRFGTYSVE